MKIEVVDTWIAPGAKNPFKTCAPFVQVKHDNKELSFKSWDEVNEFIFALQNRATTAWGREYPAPV